MMRLILIVMVLTSSVEFFQIKAASAGLFDWMRSIRQIFSKNKVHISDSPSFKSTPSEEDPGLKPALPLSKKPRDDHGNRCTQVTPEPLQLCEGLPPEEQQLLFAKIDAETASNTFVQSPKLSMEDLCNQLQFKSPWHLRCASVPPEASGDGRSYSLNQICEEERKEKGWTLDFKITPLTDPITWTGAKEEDQYRLLPGERENSNFTDSKGQMLRSDGTVIFTRLRITREDLWYQSSANFRRLQPLHCVLIQTADRRTFEKNKIKKNQNLKQELMDFLNKKKQFDEEDQKWRERELAISIGIKKLSYLPWQVLEPIAHCLELEAAYHHLTPQSSGPNRCETPLNELKALSAQLKDSENKNQGENTDHLKQQLDEKIVEMKNIAENLRKKVIQAFLQNLVNQKSRDHQDRLQSMTILIQGLNETASLDEKLAAKTQIEELMKPETTSSSNQNLNWSLGTEQLRNERFRSHLKWIKNSLERELKSSHQWNR